jgi:histidinol-phosphatase (PHP family)
MFDYHIHTKYCNHASGKMEAYVKSAIAKKLDEIGFSAHIPREFYPKELPTFFLAMSMKDLKMRYFPEISRLQEKYKKDITIKTGLEIDYFEQIQEPVNAFIDEYSEKLDYIIGSVHVLYTQGFHWGVDEKHCKVNFDKFGVDRVYDQYLDAILDLIHTSKYHILAHLDLPKKYGFRPKNLDHYFSKIGNVLDEAKKQGMSVEVSTGGLRKVIKEMYPEDHIVKMMIDRDIPLITSSDSHKPEEVAYNFTELYSYLKKLGLTRLYKYSKGQKYEIGLDDL